MTSTTVFSSEQADAVAEGGIDFHHAITKKERSSRYLRTAIDYFTRVKGKEACDAFLQEIGLARDSSIFKHIYDDENWNSYELEVYFYDRLKDKFDDPYKAIWDFGVASGSGHLDQKDALVNFKVKVAPVDLILKKVSETTEKFSLISKCHATYLPADRVQAKGFGYKAITMHFDYLRLPAGFKYPHWTSIVAGYGIFYGLAHIRKGLDLPYYKITHWPNLPSDLPNVNGRKYFFDKATKNVVDDAGKVIANAKDGPFELDGLIFNNHHEAIAQFDFKPESLWTLIARSTWQRPRIKREQATRELKDKLISELSVEHQAQLGRYEAELSEKMAEIQALKVQQDGDYFLTSLLTKPLIADRNKSETVRTQFFIEQKKKFEFRKRQSELGGDICVVDNISLQGKRYVAFANGDAMGKSMQGAGGALVLGVVFQAYLARTNFSAHQQRKAPEIWLRDCYYELQNVFISFDGSMYLSIVMGLIDEATGTMYFLNAEHPGTVLLRGGKAGFLDSDLVLRKLGTPGEEEKVRIRLFELEPGDIVIAGSDGRDDLEIGVKDTNRIINEDETEFLRRVEESHGALSGIVEGLRKRGKVTDDLSLLRIAYRTDEGPRTESSDAGHYEQSRMAGGLIKEGKLEEGLHVLEDLASRYPDVYEDYGYRGRVLYKLKRYKEAAQQMLTYCDHFPGDTESLYILSQSYKRDAAYDKAAEICERLILRDADHLDYLINLADCYRLVGNYDRARDILGKARTLDPSSPHVEKMGEILSRQGDSIHRAGAA